MACRLDSVCGVRMWSGVELSKALPRWRSKMWVREGQAEMRARQTTHERAKQRPRPDTKPENQPDAGRVPLLVDPEEEAAGDARNGKEQGWHLKAAALAALPPPPDPSTKPALRRKPGTGQEDHAHEQHTKNHAPGPTSSVTPEFAAVFSHLLAGGLFCGGERQACYAVPYQHAPSLTCPSRPVRVLAA
jgi:hypothetical protein